MKCTDCKFWTRSKTYGNSCTCRVEKPCERKHKDVARKKKREQINKKRSLRYGYGKDKNIGG
jgi:hypothetical protein